MTILEKKNRAATWILTLQDGSLLQRVLELMSQSQEAPVRSVSNSISYTQFQSQTFDLSALKREQKVKQATPELLEDLARRANLTESMDELLTLLD